MNCHQKCHHFPKNPQHSTMKELKGHFCLYPPKGEENNNFSLSLSIGKNVTFPNRINGLIPKKRVVTKVVTGHNRGRTKRDRNNGIGEYKLPADCLKNRQLINDPDSCAALDCFLAALKGRAGGFS